MELKEMVERIADIRHAKPTTEARRAVGEAAQELSRAGEMQKRVELANEALAALTVLLYQADTDGEPANIDRVTWRLLVPAPWGREGWRHWGLRSWEAEILAHILRVRNEARKHVNLFDYNEANRRWHLNCSDFPTLDKALGYLKANPITLAEWRKHHEIENTQKRARMAALRKQRG